MAQSFQKAAVALLLCAPSTLNEAWLSGDDNAVQDELVRLQLSPSVRDAATVAFAAFRPEQALFLRVSELLRDGLWAGGRPHPDPDGSLRIALALKALDGE